MQDLHYSFKSGDLASRSGCCGTPKIEDESLLCGYNVNHYEMVNAEQLHLLSDRQRERESERERVREIVKQRELERELQSKKE